MRQERKYRDSNDDASDLALADLEAPETGTAKKIEDTLRRQQKEQRTVQKLRKVVDRCVC